MVDPKSFEQFNHLSELDTNEAFIPSEKPFVLSADTKVYKIMPVVNQELEGYIWTNRPNKEMLLLLDGLPSITEKEYQAWIKTPDALHNIGLFQVLQGKGQIHIQNYDIEDVEHIIVSQEPIGGSIFPTDPNAVLIKIQY